MNCGKPAKVRTNRQGVLALDPGKVVVVLLVAVVNGLVAGTLGIHVHNGVDEACLGQARGQGDGSVCGVRPGEGQLCGGVARPDHSEILPGSDEASAKAIGEGWANLPIEAAIFTVSSQVGIAGGNRGGSTQIYLEVIRRKVS